MTKRSGLILAVTSAFLLAFLQGCSLAERFNRADTNQQQSLSCDHIANLGASSRDISQSVSVQLKSSERECQLENGLLKQTVRLNFSATRSSTRSDGQAAFAYYVSVYNSQGDLVSRQVFNRAISFPEREKTVHFTDFVALERPYIAPQALDNQSKNPVQNQLASLPHFIVTGLLGAE